MQDSLPFPQSFSYGEAGNHAMDLGPPFAHVVLDVKDKWLLAKVGVYNLTWGLEPHGWVQVGLVGVKQKNSQMLLIKYVINRQTDRQID